MRSAGSPEQWLNLIDSMVPEILGLTIETWDAMAPVGSGSLEDPTTELLCRALRQNRNAAELPLRIDLQVVELDPAEGQNQGRMDIVFAPMVPREDIYFCLECKRLSVPTLAGPTRSYAMEYVKEGMLRFVRGQYSARVRQAGMLGYVQDGDIPAAIQGVARAIGRRRVDLRIAAGDGLRPSTVFLLDNRFCETRHQRADTEEPFHMHHIFASAT